MDLGCETVGEVFELGLIDNVLLSRSVSGDRHIRLHSGQQGRAELLSESADHCP